MEVVYFLRDYWQYISTGILVIFCIILMIIKKKPLTEIVDNSIYRSLVSLICKAESIFGSGHGSEKLSYVIENYKKSLFDLGPYDEKSIDSAIRIIVEFILSTPQKKESFNEKVK